MARRRRRLTTPAADERGADWVWRGVRDGQGCLRTPRQILLIAAFTAEAHVSRCLTYYARRLTAQGPRGKIPYVNVRITRDGVTAAQKAQLVAEITATLQRVLGKRPEHTHVIIDEVEPENWGFAGLLTSEYRRQQRDAARSEEPAVAERPV